MAGLSFTSLIALFVSAQVWLVNKIIRLAKYDYVMIEYLFYRKRFKKWKADLKKENTGEVNLTPKELAKMMKKTNTTVALAEEAHKAAANSTLVFGPISEEGRKEP